MEPVGGGDTAPPTSEDARTPLRAREDTRGVESVAGRPYPHIRRVSICVLRQDLCLDLQRALVGGRR
jgi:hypothetical protein